MEREKVVARPQPVQVATTRPATGTATGTLAPSAAKVLKNTYLLLAATLLFSAITAGVSMALSVPFLGILPTLLGYFGLLFAVHKLKDSAAGLAAVFALTGFMGVTLGPLLSAYLTNVTNGGELVMTAMGLTALVFGGLSAYAVITKKDFSFLAGFVMVGLIALLGVILIQAFGLVDLSAFQMAISAGVVILMSALILFQTSAIVHGGETNYILATVTLFVSIYNLFLNLLTLLGMGDE